MIVRMFSIRKHRVGRAAAVAGLILLLLGAYPGWLLWTDNFTRWCREHCTGPASWIVTSWRR